MQRQLPQTGSSGNRILRHLGLANSSCPKACPRRSRCHSTSLARLCAPAQLQAWGPYGSSMCWLCSHKAERTSLCSSHTCRAGHGPALVAAAAAVHGGMQQQQQQHQQQGVGIPQPPPAAADPLSMAITSTASVQQLVQLVQPQLTSMGPQHITTALRHLVQLAPHNRSRSSTVIGGWSSAPSDTQTPAVQQQQLQQQWALPAPVMQQWQDQQQQQQQQQQQPGSPTHQAACALADQLLQHLLHLGSTAAAAAADGSTCHALVKCCYALGRLQHTSKQLPALLGALQPRLLRLTPKQLSNTIWALAALGFIPPPPWAASFLAASAAALPESTPQALANTVWALGRLGLQPTTAWWSSFWSASVAALPAASPGELAQYIHGCGRLQPKGGPPGTWSEAWLGASCEALRGSSPQELSMGIWGLDGAGVVPHKAWMMCWFLAAQAGLEAATPQDLSLWLYSLARLRTKPSPAWLRLYVSASFPALAACSSMELISIMWAAASLGWAPPLLYWRGCLEQVEARAAGLNQQDFATVFWAVGKMEGYELPSTDWLPEVLRHSGPLLSTMLPQQLANISWGLGRLLKRSQGGGRQRQGKELAPPGVTWQRAFASAMQQHLQAGAVTADMAQTALMGLEVWGLQSSDPSMAALRQALQRLQQQGVGNGSSI